VCIEDDIGIGNQTGQSEVQTEQSEAQTEQYEAQTRQLEVQYGQFQEVEVSLRRSSRQPQASARLKDYTTYSIQYSIQDYVSYDNVINDHYVLLYFLSRADELKKFKIKKFDSKWCKAMDDELHVLENKSNMGSMFSPKSQETGWLQVGI
jgi:hypothetical protein